MSKKKHVSLKMLLFLVFIDLLETFVQFCFKKSAASVVDFKINTFIDAIAFIRTIAPSPFLWVGILSVFLIFISWSTVLSKVDLSVAVPICSISYITVPIASMIFLGENISLLRWAGICLILTGVILVSASSTQRGHPA